MTISKKAQKLKKKADAALYKSDIDAWCAKSQIKPGLIIWKIHPGLPDGTMMEIKAHPMMIIAIIDGKALLLPLSKTHDAKTLSKPAPNKEPSAPAWDAMLLAKPEPSWKPGLLIPMQTAPEFMNEHAYSHILDEYLIEYEIALDDALIKIWDAAPISCDKFWDLKQKAKAAGHSGKPSLLAAGCSKQIKPMSLAL